MNFQNVSNRASVNTLDLFVVCGIHSCIHLLLIDTFLLLALGEDYFVLEHEQSECEVFAL